jgi:hypothetical protein
MKRITCVEVKLSEPLIDVEEAREELRQYVEDALDHYFSGLITLDELKNYLAWRPIDWLENKGYVLKYFS